MYSLRFARRLCRARGFGTALRGQGSGPVALRAARQRRRVPLKGLRGVGEKMKANIFYSKSVKLYYYEYLNTIYQGSRFADEVTSTCLPGVLFGVFLNCQPRFELVFKSQCSSCFPSAAFLNLRTRLSALTSTITRGQT